VKQDLITVICALIVNVHSVPIISIVTVILLCVQAQPETLQELALVHVLQVMVDQVQLYSAQLVIQIVMRVTAMMVLIMSFAMHVTTPHLNLILASSIA
jgi:hypothetical protein